MGTIVYYNLVELLLEEESKTEGEIVKEAIERFGFPDEEKLKCEIGLQLLMKEKSRFVSKSRDGRYHLLKRGGGYAAENSI